MTAPDHLADTGATPLPCRLPSLCSSVCGPLPDSNTTSALQAALEEQAKLENAEKDAETERRTLKSLLEFKHLEKEQDNRVARMQDIALQKGQVGGWGLLPCTAGGWWHWRWPAHLLAVTVGTSAASSIAGLQPGTGL